MSTSATVLTSLETSRQAQAWAPAMPPGTGNVVRDFVLPATSSKSSTAERAAYERGFSDGQRQAGEAAAAAMRARLDRLSATINDIAGLRSGLIRRSEQDILCLAQALAKRILHRDASADPALLLTLARRAAETLAGTGIVTIQLPPADFVAATEGRTDAAASGPIRVEANDHLLPGACIVQSSAGLIDVGLDAQLAELFDSLIGDGAR